MGGPEVSPVPQTEPERVQQSRLHRNVIGTGRRHGEPKLLNRVQIDCEVDLG